MLTCCRPAACCRAPWALVEGVLDIISLHLGIVDVTHLKVDAFGCQGKLDRLGAACRQAGRERQAERVRCPGRQASRHRGVHRCGW